MTNQTTLGYRVNCTLISLVSAAVKRLNFVRPYRTAALIRCVYGSQVMNILCIIPEQSCSHVSDEGCASLYEASNFEFKIDFLKVPCLYRNKVVFRMV